MEKAPLLIFIATSHYFCLPVFNEIFKILLGKILFQKSRQTNAKMNTKHKYKIWRTSNQGFMEFQEF